MIKLFTYDMDETRKFNAEKYLDKMIELTENNKLYIARFYDCKNKWFFDVATNETDMNAVTVLNIDWEKADINHLLDNYNKLLVELEKKKDIEEIYMPAFIEFRLYHSHAVGIAERLSKLFELSVPEFLIENDKHLLFESMVINYFADSYQNVILEPYTPVEPVKGRGDVENEKFVMEFIEKYQDVAEYIEKNVDVKTAELQKKFKMGYSFMVYMLDQLEDNCLAFEYQGRFKGTGKSVKDIRTIKVNPTPFKREDKFIDEMTEEELLQALAKIKNKKK